MVRPATAARGLRVGNVKVPTLDRLNSLIAATAHKRITYKELIA